MTARNNFHGRVNELLQHYDELLLAVHNKTRQASLEIILSEQTTMSLGVYWEAFVNDVLVAYVAKNPGNCLNDLKKRVGQNLEAKFALPAKWVRLSFPATLSSTQAERILNPKGWNISATSPKDLREKANQYLVSGDAIHFSLVAEDVEFVDLMVEMRNYLAHRSTRSRKILKSSIAKIGIANANALLSGAFTSSGAYLKACLPNDSNKRRVHELGRRLLQISKKLVP